MKTIGMVVNPARTGVVPLVERIIDWLNARGYGVAITDEAARLINRPALGMPREQLVNRVDLMMVLGGDGTLLRSARECAPRGIPILGINLGRLGFLTEIDLPEVLTELEKLPSGEYAVEERMMLEARVIRGGSVVGRAIGLNDAVITKGAFARLIFLETCVNDDFVATYPADGLIVATPTGSTAYSLSAGGPLVTPELDLLLVTPICPHSLWTRPLVISGESRVRVVLRSRQAEVMLTVDGQHGFALQPNDTIMVEKSAHRARFIRLKHRSFFYLLRHKLTEGEHNGP